MYEIFVPKSEILQKYIYSFYVMKEFSGGINYLAFPQLGMTMALFIKTTVTFHNDCVSMKKDQAESPTVLLLGKYRLPIQLKYKESVPEISINFKPAGLNYFFKKDTFELAQKQAQLIEDEQWKNLTKEVFQQETDEKKMQILENFLLKIL